MHNSRSTWMLPGRLARKEGDNHVVDEFVNFAFDHSGTVFDFYQAVFAQNSIDNNGMTLISSVHFGKEYDNAFWNGNQMVYGDGDQVVFDNFTKSLDVVGHELTHGITSYTSDLNYSDEPGALNEHFSDVMGLLIKQWKENTPADQASWYIGSEIMLRGVKGLRTFEDKKAFENDEYLGTDPQPKHMSNYVHTDDDNGGVHYNSGIPNHAFYLCALALGGMAFERAGRIWFETFTKRLHRNSDFQDAANLTAMVASQMFGEGSPEHLAVQACWSGVGITSAQSGLRQAS